MGGKKRTTPISSEVQELYERLLATAGVEHKGKNMLYTSHGGNMYSFLAKDGLVSIRLPADVREEFLRRFDSTLSVQYGTVMKEYVLVPSSVLRDTKTLSAYFKKSVAYVKSLKPKPTTRR